MQGLEVQPFKLIIAAGYINHQHLGVAGFGDQDFTDGGDVFDAADVGDQPASGAKLVERQLDDPPHLATCSANKDRVGRSQACPGIWGLSQNRRQVSNSEPLRIAGDQRIVFRAISMA